jgi:hypothetical protein
MGPKERRVYLERAWPRYQLASRSKKRQILDEFCAVCGYNRKYAVGLLNKALHGGRRRKKPGRRSKNQNPRFLEVLRRIWQAPDFMCSRRLKVVIWDWLPYYEGGV